MSRSWSRLIFAILAVMSGCTRSTQKNDVTDAAKIPDWVPLYPRSTIGARSSKQTKGEVDLWFSLRTGDDCRKVIDFYEQKLNGAGYRNVKSVHGLPDCSGTLRASTPSGDRSININTGSTAKDTSIAVEVIYRDGTGESPPSRAGGAASTASGRIPSWIPIYPGGTPENISGEQLTGEYHVSFSLRTKDDDAHVLSWYETKLQSAGLTVSSEYQKGQIGNGAIRSHRGRKSVTIFTARSDPYNMINIAVID